MGKKEMQVEGKRKGEKKRVIVKTHLLGIEPCLKSKRGKKRGGKKKIKLSTESNLGPTDEWTQRPVMC